MESHLEQKLERLSLVEKLAETMVIVLAVDLVGQKVELTAVQSVAEMVAKMGIHSVVHWAGESAAS